MYKIKDENNNNKESIYPCTEMKQNYYKKNYYK